jgi:hypothetical protein
MASGAPGSTSSTPGSSKSAGGSAFITIRPVASQRFDGSIRASLMGWRLVDEYAPSAFDSAQFFSIRVLRTRLSGVNRLVGGRATIVGRIDDRKAAAAHAALKQAGQEVLAPVHPIQGAAILRGGASPA